MLDKLGVLFVRDGRLATTYMYGFVLSWLTIPISVGTLWFVSKIVPASPAFGVHGMSATYFDFAVVNVAFLTLQTSALTTFDHSVRDGQLYGPLEMLLATPTRAVTVVLGSGLWALALTAAQIFGYLGVGALLGMRLHGADAPALLVFAVLAVLSTAPFGILSAAFVVAFKQAAPTSFTIGAIASLFGGVLFPVAVLPGPLQTISWWLPISHALNGIRGAMHGASLAALSGDALWLLVTSALLMPIALFALGAAARRGRFDGTLGQY